MKVYDIIAEAPEYTTPGGIVVPSGAKTAGPDPTKKPPSPAVSQTASDTPITDKARQAGQKVKQTIDTAKAKPGQVKGNLTDPEFLKTKTKNFIIRNKIGEHTIQNRMVKTVGSVLRIFKWLGYGEMIVNYYIETEAHDQLLELGKSEIKEYGQVVEGFTPEQWQMAVRLSRELLVTQIAASAMFAKVIKLLLNVIKGGRVGSKILGGLFAPVTAGVSIATILASEAALVYFQTWLNSEEGKRALATFLANWIDPMIKDVGLLNKELKKAEDMAKGKQDTSRPAGQAAQAAKPGAATTDLGPGTGADFAKKLQGL